MRLRVERSSVWRLPLWLLITCGVVSAIPISSLTGRVVSLGTGRPIFGVHVVAVDEGSPEQGIAAEVRETTTDSTGTYSLAPVGRTMLTFVAVGFDTLQVSSDSLCAGDENCCGRASDVALNPSR